MATKTYRGQRGPDGCSVTVNGQPLEPRADIRAISDSAFEWGYEGGGPGHLAFAILADYFADDARAFHHYREFRNEIIARLDGDRWVLDSGAIERALVTPIEVPMTLEELLNKVRGRP